jgi:hypothetical protein
MLPDTIPTTPRLNLFNKIPVEQPLSDRSVEILTVRQRAAEEMA